MEDSDLLESKVLFELLLKDGDSPFSGWDFSHIENRRVTAPLTWSYSTEILPHIRIVNSMLDMGTGGGEFLLQLAPFPPHTCATESYDPNVIIAKNRLNPLGINVVKIEGDDTLPFEDGEFELVINRHESFSIDEVYRILTPGGYFISQQVGGKNDQLLREIMGSKKKSDYEQWDLDYEINELEDNGFVVLKKKEAFPITRFFDVGAIVFYFLSIPWELPGFTVEKYREKLWEIHNVIEDNGYIDVISHRFLFKAQRN
ncbi:MAG: class I SAM-dependent methyltransferase [Candidatus Heimdallarchaeota archaeon]|nr:class I SAM-dependent methyltransferase [Candidatus Heimdallarchaeota archaeon]